MWRYILRRVVAFIPVLLGVSFIIFLLLYMTPGDPARMLYAENSAALFAAAKLLADFGPQLAGPTPTRSRDPDTPI